MGVGGNALDLGRLGATEKRRGGERREGRRRRGRPSHPQATPPTTPIHTKRSSTPCLVHELGREVDAELGGDGAEPALPVAVLRVELLDGRLARGDVRRGLLVLVVVMSPCVEPAGRGH